jgi:hypothetical protein
MDLDRSLVNTTTRSRHFRRQDFTCLKATCPLSPLCSPCLYHQASSWGNLYASPWHSLNHNNTSMATCLLVCSPANHSKVQAIPCLDRCNSKQ